MNQNSKGDGNRGQKRGNRSRRSYAKPHRKATGKKQEDHHGSKGGDQQKGASAKKAPSNGQSRGNDHRPNRQPPRDKTKGQARSGQKRGRGARSGQSRQNRQKQTRQRVRLDSVSFDGRALFAPRSEGGKPLRYTILFGTRTWNPLRHEAPSGLSDRRYFQTVQLDQVHGDRIHLVGSAAHATVFPREGDALVTQIPQLALVIATADCIPLMLVDTRARVIAAVHAGWRGLAAQLPSKVVERMSGACGIQPDRFQAFLGPSICSKCYRVGDEVIQSIAKTLPEDDARAVARRYPDGYHLDLAGTVKKQLLAAGLTERNIHGGLPCTCCSEEILYSHRRSNGATDRMYSIICLNPVDDDSPPKTHGRADLSRTEGEDETALNSGGRWS